MSMEALLTLLVLASAVALFVSEKLPMDVVAMLVLASLLLLGLVTPDQALSGFSNEATITVAAMFVLSAGLAHTGALRGLGRLFAKVRSRWLFLLLLIGVAGAISAFINNTAVVAVFLPMVLAACAQNGQSPSQVLIPLSYAAQMGGVCTLVGTSTNLLVNSLAKDLGHPGFGLFDFTPLGLVTMGVGLVYLAVFSRFLLPRHPAEPITDAWQLGQYVTELKVMPGSSLIGRSVASVQFPKKHGIDVLELIRGEQAMWSPEMLRLREGDLLLVRGEWERLSALKEKYRLEPRPEFRLSENNFGGSPDSGGAKVLIEVMVAPNARLAGQSLEELDFTRQHEATVLAVHRRGELLRERLRDLVLSVGDVLLILAPRAELALLRREEHLIVLNEREEFSRPRGRAWLALAIVIAVIAAAGLGWLPIMAAAILGAIALVVTRCIGNEQAYAAVDWRVIVLLAGILPLGIAMQNSGLAKAGADVAVAAVGGFGPMAMLAMVYLLTALLTEVMSNNAAAVLITPIAFSTAVSLGLDPTPFIVAVLFAASTSFSTPVGYQTNMMVYNAGNYRFADFLRMGLPLNLMFWALAVWLIPQFFPFK